MKKINYLSSNLRKLLKNKGVSQAWLAEKLGKDRTSIGAYINEKSQPDIDITIKISTIFGITLDELILKNLTSENYSHSEQSDEVNERPVNYKNEKNSFENAFEDFIRDTVKKSIAESSLDVDKSTLTKIDYIYNMLKQAELEGQKENTVKKTQKA